MSITASAIEQKLRFLPAKLPDRRELAFSVRFSRKAQAAIFVTRPANLKISNRVSSIPAFHLVLLAIRPRQAKDDQNNERKQDNPFHFSSVIMVAVVVPRQTVH